MRWFSNSSKWDDPIDVTVKYNIEKDVELLDSIFDEYALSKLHPTQKKPAANCISVEAVIHGEQNRCRFVWRQWLNIDSC